MEKNEPNKTLLCSVCEHEHDEKGNCECGCEVEQQLEQFCWSCGHVMHVERACKCGCEG